MKATEQYFPVVLFITLYKVVLTFESVDEILKRDHSNESYWAVLSCGAVYYAVQGGSKYRGSGWNLNVTIQIKLIEQQFSDGVQLIMLYKMVLTWDLWIKPKISPFRRTLSCCSLLWCAVYCAAQGGWYSGQQPSEWAYRRNLLSSHFMWFVFHYFTKWKLEFLSYFGFEYTFYVNGLKRLTVKIVGKKTTYSFY